MLYARLVEQNAMTVLVEATPEKIEKELIPAARRDASIQIDGFRKQKAPINMIIKKYGREHLEQLAYKQLVTKSIIEAQKIFGFVATNYSEANRTEDNIAYIYVPLDWNKKIEGYKGIKVPKDNTSVTDLDVERELDHQKLQNARISVVDRPAQEGDRVQAILDISQNGASANRQLLEVNIGSEKFHYQLNERLLGLKAGESVDFISGQELYPGYPDDSTLYTFHVTAAEVATVEYPTIDDDFAQDVSEFYTLSEYKEDIRKRLAKSIASSKDTRLLASALEKLLEANDYAIPPDMADYISYISLDPAVRAQSPTFRTFQAAHKKLLERDIENSILNYKLEELLTRISFQDNIAPTPSEVDARLKELGVKDDNGLKENLVSQMRLDMVKNVILDTLIEVDPDQESAGPVDQAAAVQ
ncbi:MAG: hypothetical protein LBT59_14910 [Clostridiales bacterium]|jgi:trigger factor|nr:hypothetical protein [Clostridiales bacterium]